MKTVLEICASTSTVDMSNSSSTDLDDDLDRIRFVAYAIVTPIIVLLGVTGNVCALLVLKRRELRGIAYKWLSWLSFTNIITLLVVAAFALDRLEIELYSYSAAWYFAHMSLPLVNTFLTTSVYITITITIDRYLASCHMLLYNKFHTLATMRTCVALSYLLAAIFNFPLCFMKQVCRDPNKPGRYFVSKDEELMMRPVWAAYTWGAEVLLRLGPTIVMAYLNYRIIYQLYQLKNKRIHLTSKPASTRLAEEEPSQYSIASQTPRSSDNSTVSKAQQYQKGSWVDKYLKSEMTEEHRVTLFLVFLVILYLLCTTPAAVLSILIMGRVKNEVAFEIFRAVANNLEFLNYALNFYLYCVCGKEFRNVAKLTFNWNNYKMKKAPNGALTGHMASVDITGTDPQFTSGLLKSTA